MIPSNLDPSSLEYVVDRFVDARGAVYRAARNEIIWTANRLNLSHFVPEHHVEAVVDELEHARMYGKAAGLKRIDIQTIVERILRKS